MQPRQCKLFVYEEIIINILNRLPLKSLTRFKCTSKNWRKYIAEIYRCRLGWPQPYLIGFFCVEDRSQIRFFFSSKESPLLIGTSLDYSVSFISERVYVVASSNGFLLCNKLTNRPRVYYVYNPVTKQCLDLPESRLLMKDPCVGFSCKVDEDEPVSFTIVRYEIPLRNLYNSYSLTIESFSSETNAWTELVLHVNLPLHPYWYMTASSSACVVDEVFCWLSNRGRLITIYDSVKQSFWVLNGPQQMLEVYPSSGCLGLSGGQLCLASKLGTTTITCWRLSNFPGPDNAVWIRMYVVNVATMVQKCPVDFGLGRSSANLMKVRNIHPALPHILYLQIRGKVISYDVKTRTAELVYDFGEAWRETHQFKLFSYEWPQWPRLV